MTALRTCARGHLTLFRSCPVCKDTAAKLRIQLSEAKAENKELKRRIKNLTDAIAAGRAF